jgi:sarcosine oxidase
VIGAGIVGLATAVALLDAGAEVRLYDRDAPALAQSKGRTRVFRLAHGEARLVDLAACAERLWRAWEERFQRRLVGDEGLVVTGDDTVAAWTKAMADAGARHAVLSIEEASARIPVARLSGSVALFDPAAGPTRARRTVECLLAVCTGCLRREEVLEIGQTATACTVNTAAGSWKCDEVVIAAGTETGRLAGAGIGVETLTVPDSRLTFSIREGYRDRPLACWFDQSETYGPGCSSYGQRVGSTSFYAVGVGWGDAEGLSADEESALHREKALDYMREAYPGLDPTPVAEIRCTSALRGVREDGDGFMARRSGGVTALYGKNLFKFAPLLGELLAQTALTGALADELAPERV